MTLKNMDGSIHIFEKEGVYCESNVFQYNVRI